MHGREAYRGRPATGPARRAAAGAIPTAALAIVAAFIAAACAGNRVDPAGDEGPGDAVEDGAMVAAQDTARGVVAVVGADPITTVTLRTSKGSLPLHGPVTDTLRRLAGIEVRVSGERRQDGAFAISSFRVRAADGMPARDGILDVDGDVAVLVEPDGHRVSYGPAPRALRQLAGQRVWIAGVPGEAVESWGLVGPPR